jgi:ribonuclease HI
LHGFKDGPTDGASKSTGTTSCGGIIRGSYGECFGGFANNLGTCSAFVAELWGVLEGLQYDWRLGFREVELMIDSKIVVNTLLRHSQSSHSGWSLCKQIRRFLQWEWEVKIHHSYREANMCADALANLGCMIGLTMTFYEGCPTQVSDILIADKSGVSFSI